MQLAFTYPHLKKCLLGLVLLTYLMGTFQEGILEITHYLSHNFNGGHSYHSHHANSEDAHHEHEILDITKTVFRAQGDSTDFQEKEQPFSFKKIPQFWVSPTLQPTLVGLKNKNIPISNLQLPPTPFLQINGPPPDFTA